MARDVLLVLIVTTSRLRLLVVTLVLIILPTQAWGPGGALKETQNDRGPRKGPRSFCLLLKGPVGAPSRTERAFRPFPTYYRSENPLRGFSSLLRVRA